MGSMKNTIFLLLHAGGQFIFIIHCHFSSFHTQFREAWHCTIWQQSGVRKVHEGHVSFNTHNGSDNNCKFAATTEMHTNAMYWSTSQSTKRHSKLPPAYGSYMNGCFNIQ